MLKAVFLALCLDAALLLAFSLLPEAPASAGTETATGTLLVQLGSTSQTPAVLDGAARSHNMPVAPRAAEALETSPVTEPVSVGSMPVDGQPAAVSDDREQEAAQMVGWVGDQADDFAAGGPAPAGQPTEAAGSSGGSGSVVPGSGASAELIRRIDALVRERLVYPPLARRRNIEGVVKVTILIDEHGRLGGSSLTSGSGSSILDRAAISLIDEIFPISLAKGLEEPVQLSIMISYSLTS
jgi:TonB family protein